MKVSVKHVSDRKRASRWLVVYYFRRNPKRKFFETKGEAEEYAKRLREQMRAGGGISTIIFPQHVAVGTGYTLADIVKAGLEGKLHCGVPGPSPTATFADGCDLVVQRAIARERRPNTIAGYRHTFAVLRKTFGSKLASSLTETEVQQYLDNLTGHWGRGKASVYTQKSVLLAIRMALRAVGAINPLPHILLRFPESREIAYFTVEEVRRLF
ncbi:MAG: hypothetical protein ACREGF_04940, partial [Candidatus Saccharimonadales bacterium]